MSETTQPSHQRLNFPSKEEWLSFFDKALLIIGVVALALSLVFFIAYNWLHMGKMGKFVLVEGVLALSVLGYGMLAYQRKHPLLGQLLLLTASILTGVLLALFGQVYQTGADTWQLFFSWALFITPFVLIARLPALWLLWLGLLNASFIGYTHLNDLFFIGSRYNTAGYAVATFIINAIALILWIYFVHRRDNTGSRYHWSIYLLGLVVTVLASRLGGLHTHYSITTGFSIIAFLCWTIWAALSYWQYRHRHLDLLMLTYLCGSIIYVVMISFADTLLDSTGGVLIMAILIIGMSAGAVAWLRSLGKSDVSQNKETADGQ